MNAWVNNEASNFVGFTDKRSEQCPKSVLFVRPSGHREFEVAHEFSPAPSCLVLRANVGHCSDPAYDSKACIEQYLRINNLILLSAAQTSCTNQSFLTRASEALCGRVTSGR
uniref:Peptidase S1 domain-containing protein n=1 Tax=Trichuris muris TaxID=70415 RepID=A0A5S6QNW4_TRIMR